MCVYFLFFSLLFSSVSSAFSSLPPLLSPQLLPLLFFSFLFFSFAFVALHSLSCLLSSFSSVFSSTSSVSSLLPFFLLPLSFLPFLPPLFPSFSATPFVSSASLAFCPLLLPSHLPSYGFFCSFHLFLSLLFKSPVNFACSWYLSQLMSPLSTSFVPKLGQS